MANPCYSHKLLLSRFPKKFENKDVFLPVRQSELASLLPKGFLRRKIISGQTLKEFGAFRLAATIRAYWVSEGFPEPKVRVEQISTNNKDAYYVVRSDMVGGMPAGKRGKKAA